MKKITSFILAAVLCLSFVGCSQAAAVAGTKSGGDVVSSPTPEESKSASAAAAVDNKDASADEKTQTAESEEAPEAQTVVTLSDKGIAVQGTGAAAEGSTVTVTAEGVYRITGSLSDGQIAVDAKDAKVVLILDGVDVTCSGSAALYVAEADKVTLFLAEGSENALTSEGEFTDPEGKIDAAVFAKDDLTVKGTGTLTVRCETGHGIVSKDDLKIKSGSVTVTAAKKGLSGNDSVEIEGGSITVDSGKDAIHAENADDASLGNVTISGGTLDLVSGSDGIDASGSVTVEGGTLAIRAADDAVRTDGTLSVSGGELTVIGCYEGLEASVIEISGGVVDITASDDGINATSGSSSSSGWGWGGEFAPQSGVAIRISGGTVTVNANGDGVDSNGDLYVTGGMLYISGPTNNGNGAIDYNGTGSVTGGTVIAAGAAGMAENFGSSSTQGVILYNLSSAQSGGTTVTLSDDSGKVLASYTPEKSYQSVVVSAPGMESGGTYTLTCGSVSETITLSSAVWSNGGQGGMMGGPGGMPGFPGGNQGDSGQTGGFGGPGGFPGGPNGDPSGSSNGDPSGGPNGESSGSPNGGFPGGQGGFHGGRR